MYVRVWTYEVAEATVDAFIAAYGAEGDWAQLFGQAQGYLGTELYRGTADPTQFITVDRWESAAAWSAFLQEWGQRYQRLDGRLAGLSTSQRALIEASR